jgi:hypothetical protein
LSGEAAGIQQSLSGEAAEIQTKSLSGEAAEIQQIHVCAGNLSGSAAD